MWFIPLLIGGSLMAGAVAILEMVVKHKPIPPKTAPTVIPPTPPPVARFPAPISNVNVAGIQHALNALGYTPHLDEDGKAGPKTAANVKIAQANYGLTQNGVIDQSLADKLTDDMKQHGYS